MLRDFKCTVWPLQVCLDNTKQDPFQPCELGHELFRRAFYFSNFCTCALPVSFSEVGHSPATALINKVFLVTELSDWMLSSLRHSVFL